MTVQSQPLSEEALDQILAEYFEAVEAGQCPDRQEWLRRYPEAADALSDFFADQDRFRQRVAPLRECLGGLVTEDCFPAAGTQIGHYELLEEIARGGMGIVFKARQVQLNRTVALKMILMGALATPAEQQRFRLEAESAARLDHPNIVPIYEIDTWQGQPYFSMRLVEGGSLAQWLAAGRVPRADWRTLAQLLATLARAVHHAHQRGILHRDLKPANILLQTDSTASATLASAIPLISDFGLAHWLHGNPAPAAEASSQAPPPVGDRLTHSGVAVGTPSYMAPEQVKTKERGAALTTATDVYSLGAILYELLIGPPPFRAANVRETLRCVVEQQPVPPRRHDPHVPSDLEAICLKCLEKEPARRYGSAAALAEDLERSLRGEPVEARPLGALGRWGRWCRRQPALALSCALAVAGLLSMAVVSVCFAWSEAQGRARLDEAASNLAGALDDVQDQKRLAEENYRKAHQVIEDFFVRYSTEELRQVDSLLPLRKELLETALTYFRDFLEQKRDDPALREDLAATCIRVAGISAALGSLREALTSYDQGLDLFEQLQKEGPPSWRAQVFAARAYGARGTLLDDLGRDQEAMGSFARSLELFRALHRAGPSDGVAFDLAFVLTHASAAHCYRCQLDKAHECLLEAQRLVDPVLARAPGKADFEYLRGYILSQRGDVWAREGKRDQACQAYQQARPIQEQRARKLSHNATAQSDFARTTLNLGTMLRQRGQADEGRRLIEFARDRFDQLVQANPSVPGFLQLWAEAMGSLGDWELRTGDLEKARRTFGKMLDRLDPLHTRYGELMAFQDRLAHACFSLGAVHLRQKGTGKALVYLERARQHGHRLIEHYRTSHEFRARLGLTMRSLGEALAESNRPVEAIASLRESIALTQGVPPAFQRSDFGLLIWSDYQALVKLQKAARQPDEVLRSWQEARDLLVRLIQERGDDRWRGTLAAVLMDYSSDLREQNRHQEAVAALEQACQEWHKWQKLNLRESLAQLSACHTRIAQVCKALGDGAADICHCEQACSLQGKLLALEDSPRVRLELALTLNNLGLALLRQDQLVEAEAQLRQAIGQQRRLVDAEPKRADLRTFLSALHQNLALVLRKANKPSELELVVLERQKWTDQPSDLVAIAGHLGWCSQEVGNDKKQRTPQEQAESDRLADLAVAALRRAAAGGLKSLAEATEHSDFAVVRTRPGFLQLVQEQNK
jgi:serine/threonine protein kinase/tetratricopeptide (TPR) repeat protein